MFFDGLDGASLSRALMHSESCLVTNRASQPHRHTDTQTDTQTDIHTDRHTDRHTDIHTDRHTDNV
ncbi:hypothetical protein DPMN_188410 [Dreissena polymorpha]|uniref:Uncharacterized protein n=1 Tax=Dreissena polymorpha TaxID=45954 RepID=A0A9D4I8H1_DREPO|nr:hypothetical protein DPMN_188410 [Dreissena polymorpha]